MENQPAQALNESQKSLNSTSAQSQGQTLTPEIIKANFEANLALSKKNSESNLNDANQKTDQGKEVNNIFDALEEEEKKESSASGWKWSEKFEGEGEKPEWLRKDFKTVEAQAKAYNDLVKKFGALTGAPESYDFKNVENSKYHVHSEAENSKEFAKIAKEMNLSQSGFEKILKFFNEKVAPTFKNSGSPSIDSKAEIAKLGDGGVDKIKTLDTWLKNTQKENYQVLRNMMRSAEEINALWSLRRLTIASDTSESTTSPSIGSQSKADRHAYLQSRLKAVLQSGNQEEKNKLMQEYREVFG